MKTDYVIPGVPPELCKERETPALTAALNSVARQKIERAREQFERSGGGFTPGNQPRDSRGKFRQILARLKFDLGDAEQEQIVNEIKEAERHADTGDIAEAAKAGQSVIKMVDAIDDGVLDPESINNVRQGAADLGRALAYLPLPQGDANAKVRFTDLPETTKRLVQDMIERVEKKIGSDDAASAVQRLKNFMAGGEMMTSDEMSAELNKLLRLLT